MKVPPVSANGFTIVAHQGDAKTLLAFNLTKAKTKNLSGFTIHCKPGNKKGRNCDAVYFVQRAYGIVRTGARK